MVLGFSLATGQLALHSALRDVPIVLCYRNTTVVWILLKAGEFFSSIYFGFGLAEKPRLPITTRAVIRRMRRLILKITDRVHRDSLPNRNQSELV